MPDLTRPEVLNKAAALIETYGHAVGRYSDGHGYCAFGAIRAAIAGGPDDMPADGPARDLYTDTIVGLGRYLAATGDPVYREVGGMIVSWSDRSTPEHVVAVLRAAAVAVLP